MTCEDCQNYKPRLGKHDPNAQTALDALMNYCTQHGMCTGCPLGAGEKICHVIEVCDKFRAAGMVD